MQIEAKFLENNGKPMFAIITYDEYKRINELLEDLEDLQDLREAKMQDDPNEPSVSLDEVKLRYGFTE